eukprot:TRINITY_DN5510_c1_g1_i1.p1 TRINITY_DN5510_c1_g1~~TRINITY_DN5510_c1_g1_i1.p1  ORF type:complete len:449 (+),score=107.20 TRINITY_DN5510_c1_g1_i1:58-1404(+)
MPPGASDAGPLQRPPPHPADDEDWQPREGAESGLGYTPGEWEQLDDDQKGAVSALRKGYPDEHTAPILRRWEGQLRLRLKLGLDVGGMPPPRSGPRARPLNDGQWDEELLCTSHGPIQLPSVLSQQQVDAVRDVWERYKHDMYDEYGERLPDGSRPVLRPEDAAVLGDAAGTVARQMAAAVGNELAIDHLTVSATNGIGHHRHADNEVFRVMQNYGGDCTGCSGQNGIRHCQRCFLPYCCRCGPEHPCDRDLDPVEALQAGAKVTWSPGKTSYRNYSCSVALTHPEEYTGGEVLFWENLGSESPCLVQRCDRGSGVMFCGCSKSIHSVHGVSSGFRLVLLLWTRPANQRPQGSVQALHRPGTGPAVWLTSPELVSLERGTYGSPNEAAPEARAALRALSAVASGPCGSTAAARICADVLMRTLGSAGAADVLREMADELSEDVRSQDA